MNISVQRNGLAYKLVVYALSFFLLLTLITAGAQYFMSESLEQRNREASILYTIENFSPLVADSLWNFEESSVAAQAAAMARNPYVSGVEIIDTTESVRLSAGELLVDRGTPDAPANAIERYDHIDPALGAVREYRFALVREVRGEQLLLGVGRLYSAERLVAEQLRPVVRVTLGIVVMSALIFALAVVIGIMHFIARPLGLLAKAVNAISPGYRGPAMTGEEVADLGRRRDELGTAFQALQEMQIGLAERDREILQHQSNLEEMVEERTRDLQQANDALAETIDKLKLAQDDLVEAEKMASLGGLVSGVAHEVNTPLGVSVTAASHLDDEVRTMRQAVASGALTKTQFDAFLGSAGESCDIILGNLRRAAQLISSFKQVAVDQSSEEQREILLRSYIEDVLRSLLPRLKHTAVTVEVTGDDTLQLLTYPGALAQIVTNLVMNAIIHGFAEGKESGRIVIDIELERDQSVSILFSDDGAGMKDSVRQRIFEPFFTTRRGQGGSGLGLNIVYNLVVQRLRGKIRCESAIGKGTQFHISLPQTPQAEEITMPTV
ncbi:ATP-binding protein [Salinispirillum sp. LH 10-3-1]|uniref:histidine kinase n=1 Tax=Salinispirillum sp. LH 10-3-1 TaxID=2952525 RepID=A0AB38YEL2_9GAMM